MGYSSGEIHGFLVKRTVVNLHRQTEIAMLILTRREGESIVLSPGSEDPIGVQVMKAGNQVSLGIDASLEVEILRKELVQN
jgi:carbon storage regulator CsrA